jgi:hypothetical protein
LGDGRGEPAWLAPSREHRVDRPNWRSELAIGSDLDVGADIPQDVLYQNAATRQQIEPLISVDTWVPNDSRRRVFEFAQFSDSELAPGITIAHRRLGGGRRVTTAQVARVRNTSQKLDQIWGKRFRPSPLRLSLRWPSGPPCGERLTERLKPGDRRACPWCVFCSRLFAGPANPLGVWLC